jgi:aminopeptidase YwaD
VGRSGTRGRWAGAARLASLSIALAAATVVVLAAEPLPSALELSDWVRELAGPAMDGRAAGTPGADRAAAYVAGHFQRIGLKPLGDQGTYFQRFPVLTRVRPGPDNTLRVAAGGQARAFVPGTDFLPFAFSDDGDVRGEAVFAGYGITAPPLGYDDYAGLDVQGKVVLVMTGEPQEQNPAGPFRASEHFHYSELRHKILNAREHGAAAIVVVEQPGRPQDAPHPLRGTTPAWGIVAMSATRAVAEALLAPLGLGLAGLQAEIDRALTPRSRALAGVTAELRVRLLRERGETANVVGLLPGTDATLRDEAVVVGAHYDHLGRGNPASLDPTHAGDIHPGADDNASGTAAVVGLAEAFARSGGARRSLVFVAFSGEEIGLLGSTHYVRHAPVPLERTVAMVNFDMVGRLRDDKLHVMGVDTGRGLRALVEQAAAGLGLTLALRGDGVAPSDHTPFLSRERPVLFFFTGTHADYHRPSDTWDKINAEGIRKVAALAYRTARALAERDGQLEFVGVPGPPGGSRGEGRGYGPYLGIVPDFGEATTPGVRLGGVRAGSPAERAGLQPGDVILRFAGVQVRTLDDLTFALRQKRPGDVVEVTYARAGTEHTVKTTLEQRR